MLSYMNLCLTSVSSVVIWLHLTHLYWFYLNIALWHKCAEQLWVDLLLVC